MKAHDCNLRAPAALPPAHGWSGGATYYAKNKTKILRRAKKQYAALSKDERRKRIEYAVNYQKQNRARYLEQRRNRCAASARSWRAEVPENYVRHALSVGSPVKAHQWPQSLVQLKQIQMKVRKLWLHQRTSKN
jgi:ATPase subunit of ABC transporter with duplicated ATPase domains